MENTLKANAGTEKRGITGSTLKLIAIIAMFIDHIGAIILERMLMQRGLRESLASYEASVAFMEANGGLYMADMVLRLIGRLGFPIFCFLLIEGLMHTRDIKKYAVRLFLFALISEIPFDLGFAGTFVYWGHQNVFLTLFIGLLVMIGFKFIENKREWNKLLQLILYFAILFAGTTIAELMRTDYGAMGIITIVVMYLFRNKRILSAGLGCTVLTAMSLTEITAFFTLLPIHFYNGKRGWNIKWLFYAFYPVHILLIYLIAYAMGLGQISLRF